MCLDKGKIWELQERRRWALNQAGKGGEGRDDFPGEAAGELSAEGCLNTSQAKRFKKSVRGRTKPNEVITRANHKRS